MDETAHAALIRPAVAAIAVLGAFVSFAAAAVAAAGATDLLRSLLLGHGILIAALFMLASVAVLERRPWAWAFMLALAAAHLWALATSFVLSGAPTATPRAYGWSLVALGYHSALIVVICLPSVRAACAGVPMRSRA